MPEPERLAVVLDRVAEAKIAERWCLFGPECDERRRRLWAASEAKTHGPGGVALVAAVTELSEETIRRGLVELESGERLGRGQVRRSGGGRRPAIEADPSVVDDLDRLIDPVTRGDPESPLRWTSKSLGKLREALVGMGHEISERTLGKLLKGQGFRLQANQKTREGSQHPDRDQQFEHINQTVKAALAAGQPVISIDCKKKELGVPRTQQGGSSRRSDRVDAVTALEMEGLARWGWWSSAVALQGEAANHRKVLRSRAVVLSVAGKGAPSSASGMGQEGERKRSTDDVSKASR